jgi:hypothetical protein
LHGTINLEIIWIRYINVTKISNKSGSEKIGINSEYKKKNVTSLSAIRDDNKLPIGIAINYYVILRSMIKTKIYT